MYLLGTHSDVLNQLTAGVRDTYSEEKDITVASLSDLALLNAVLEESLRLFPPIGFPSICTYIRKLESPLNRI